MKLLIFGSTGMVGSSLIRTIKKTKSFSPIYPERSDLDLLNFPKIVKFLNKVKPDCIVIAAAKVGGIYANDKFPAEFIYENSVIQNNVIHAAHLSNINKLIFLGSSCIYPRLAKQPIKEEALLSGYLEPTNEPYAIAKISGIKMCESYNRQYNRDYRSIMPTNLYGPGDNFHLKNSHVIPSLIKKFLYAVKNNENEVLVWGTGEARREFLFVDDLSDAIIKIIKTNKKTYNKFVSSRVSHINIGVGKDISIKELAIMIKEIVNFNGTIKFDKSKPDGMPRKCLNVDKAKNMGWKSKTDLFEGLKKTYNWFCENTNNIKNI